MTMTDVAETSKPLLDADKFRLLHTMIRVRDLDASLNFYTDQLGMKLLRKRDYPSGKFTLAFVGYGDETNSTVIELTHNWEQAEPYNLGSAFGHLAIGGARCLQGLRAARRGRGQDPAPGRPDGAWRLGDRVHRRPRRLSHRADRAIVVPPAGAAAQLTGLGGLPPASYCPRGRIAAELDLRRYGEAESALMRGSQRLAGRSDEAVLGVSRGQLRKRGEYSSPKARSQFSNLAIGWNWEDAVIELLERQKKLTANQWKLICTANVADLLDFFDFFLIGYVTAALTKEWSLTYWQGGAILLASGLGAVPGAFIWGWLGDRIGRRTVFIWSAVTISLATGIMVFTPGPNALIPGWLFLMFFRVFVGIGNAGIFTIDLPLVQEFIPAYKRGWVSALVTTLLPGGGMLAGFVAAWLLPIVGWRYLFLVGLSPLVLVFMIRYWVPESPRWLIRMGRHEEARQSLAWALMIDPKEIALPADVAEATSRRAGSSCSNIRGWSPPVA